MTRHSSISNKLRNVNPIRGKTHNVTTQKMKIYYVKIKVTGLVINFGRTKPLEIDKSKSKIVALVFMLL